MKHRLKILLTATYTAIFLAFVLTGSLQSQAVEARCDTEQLVDRLEMSLLEILVAN